MNTSRRLMLGVVSTFITGASAVGCATPPAHGTDAVANGRATEICQNVMGLSPSERLRGGNWLGNDRLDYWTSYYRGCVGSLSDSLQGAKDTEVVKEAEDQCRAKGLSPGSPDLALCVLQTANRNPEPSRSSATAGAATAGVAVGVAAAGQTPTSAPAVAAGSFYFASAHEIAQREQVACAALGLSPAQSEFKGCVQQLSSTFYAIDHPIS